MAGTQWHERASALEIDGRAFIDGQRVWARSGQAFDDHSPIDGRLLARVARGDVADIDAAVAAARAAFDDRRWAGKPPASRKRTLIKFADLVMKYTAELALRQVRHPAGGR